MRVVCMRRMGKSADGARLGAGASLGSRQRGCCCTVASKAFIETVMRCASFSDCRSAYLCPQRRSGCSLWSAGELCLAGVVLPGCPPRAPHLQKVQIRCLCTSTSQPGMHEHSAQAPAQAGGSGCGGMQTLAAGRANRSAQYNGTAPGADHRSGARRGSRRPRSASLSSRPSSCMSVRLSERLETSSESRVRSPEAGLDADAAAAAMGCPSVPRTAPSPAQLKVTADCPRLWAT